MENSSLIKHCPGCGSLRLNWPSSKNFECADCGFTLYLNIASAVGVIIECQGKILFGIRKNEPKKGMLDLPGGFVDPDETAEDGARREVREELGIDVGELKYFCSFPNRYLYRGIEYHTLDLIFLLQMDKQPDARAADDLEGFIWVRREDVEYEKIGFESLRKAVREYVSKNGDSMLDSQS